MERIVDMKKKLLCIALIVFMVIPFIYACQPKKDGNESANSQISTDDELLGLPHRNFGGKKISILTVNEKRGNIYYDREFASNEITGEAINDAVYERTQILSEKYGIEIEVKYTDSPSNDYKNQILAGDDTHQIIADGIVDLAKLGIANLLWDLNKVPNLNFENSWWDQSAIRDLSTAGYNFYLAGDIIVSDNNATWVCFFNKKLLEDYGLEHPYQMVKDGTWTIDELYSMAKVVSVANQGLTEITYENGTFGFLTQTYDAIASMASFNQKMITKNDNDYPLLNIQNENTFNKFGKIFEVMNDKTTSLIAERLKSPWDPIVYDWTLSTFAAGRGLFQYGSLSYVQKIINANVSFEYGVLPLPKYDVNQDEYYSTCTVYRAHFIGIPKTVPEKDLDMIGYFLEVMGYYGQKQLIPAYYETTIKSQKMNDQQDDDMLDIIFANRVFDLAAVYDFDSALYMYSNIVGSGVNTLASTVDSRSDSIQARIDATIEDFASIDQ